MGREIFKKEKKLKWMVQSSHKKEAESKRANKFKLTIHDPWLKRVVRGGQDHVGIAVLLAGLHHQYKGVDIF